MELYIKEPLYINIALRNRVRKTAFKFLKKLPMVKNKVNEEMAKTEASMVATLHSGMKDQSFIQRLPAEGMNEV